MKSLGAMVKQLGAMLGTSDLNAWEQGFVENVVSTTDDGANTARLSDAQVAKVEGIYAKHFGDA